MLSLSRNNADPISKPACKDVTQDAARFCRAGSSLVLLSRFGVRSRRARHVLSSAGACRSGKRAAPRPATCPGWCVRGRRVCGLRRGRIACGWSRRACLCVVVWCAFCYRRSPPWLCGYRLVLAMGHHLPGSLLVCLCSSFLVWRPGGLLVAGVAGDGGWLCRWLVSAVYAALRAQARARR